MVDDRENLELTERQRAFVVAFVASGGKNATEAAREAGFSAASARQEAWRLLRKPHVQAAIRAERARAIGTEGGSLAWSVIEGILKDERSPVGVRFEAAKFVMGLAGHVAPKPGEEQGDTPTSLEDMTVAQLEEIIRRGEARKAGNADQESANAGDALAEAA